MYRDAPRSKHDVMPLLPSSAGIGSRFLLLHQNDITLLLCIQNLALVTLSICNVDSKIT
jgi:hypothetical protein